MKNENNNNNFEAGDDSLLNGWINAKKTMQLLCIKTTNLYYLRMRKELEATKVGRKYFYSLKSIQDMLNRNASK